MNHSRPLSVPTRSSDLFAKYWTGCAGSDYYGYREDSNDSRQGRDMPGNLRANLAVLSLRTGFWKTGGKRDRSSPKFI